MICEGRLSSWYLIYIVRAHTCVHNTRGIFPGRVFLFSGFFLVVGQFNTRALSLHMRTGLNTNEPQCKVLHNENYFEWCVEHFHDSFDVCVCVCFVNFSRVSIVEKFQDISEFYLNYYRYTFLCIILIHNCTWKHRILLYIIG